MVNLYKKDKQSLFFICLRSYVYLSGRAWDTLFAHVAPSLVYFVDLIDAEICTRTI